MGFDDVDETGALIGRPKAAREDWLAYGKTSAVHLPGGSHRFGPRFLLLSSRASRSSCTALMPSTGSMT